MGGEVRVRHKGRSKKFACPKRTMAAILGQRVTGRTRPCRVSTHTRGTLFPGMSDTALMVKIGAGNTK